MLTFYLTPKSIFSQCNKLLIITACLTFQCHTNPFNYLIGTWKNYSCSIPLYSILYPSWQHHLHATYRPTNYSNQTIQYVNTSSKSCKRDKINNKTTSETTTSYQQQNFETKKEKVPWLNKSSIQWRILYKATTYASKICNNTLIYNVFIHDI
jgi:hypothetical protein